MYAVLAPGLGKCFEFYIGGIAADLVVEALNLFHFLCVEGEQPVATAIEKLFFGKSGQGDPFHMIAGNAAVTEEGFDGAEAVALDGFVAEEILGQPVQVILGQVTGQAILRRGCGHQIVDTQFSGAAFEHAGGHVGYAWAQGDLDHIVHRFSRGLNSTAFRVRGRMRNNPGRIGDGINQERGAKFFDKGGARDFC